MDLRSDNPYWLLRHGLIHSYPSLSKNIRTQVIVVGAGISGALVAWQLCQLGFDVTIADRRHIGMGSTVASTALLQYEIDTPLHKLINKVGEANAVKSYQLCSQAIYDLEKICHKIKCCDVFAFKPSFQFASYKKDVPGLQQEFTLRKKAGFDLQWLNAKDIKNKYGFSKPAGLLSINGAELDAYKFTHTLLQNAARKGLQIYDHTPVTQIRHLKKGIELTTAGNCRIKADKLVIACGYESQRYIEKQVQQLHSTYVIASEQMQQQEFWYKNSLIWETAEPYLYLRTTPDNRIIAGGKDVDFTDPLKRDKLLQKKSADLEKSFLQLFPDITFKTDFRWAGSFASTKDGLPYIGSIRQHPDTYFALGYGGNGITFSVIAAQIIGDLIQGKKNPDAAIFSFDR